MSAMFLAGAFNGVSQDLLFHYNEFETTFPHADPQFWDPEISWVNKYKNGERYHFNGIGRLLDKRLLIIQINK